MAHKSMARLKDYLLDCLFYTVISMIWYRGLLFRCMPEMTYAESKVMLWCMIGISILVCTFILDWRIWTGWTFVKALGIPYGVYTVIVYSKTVGSWLTIVLGIASVLSMVYIILLMSQKIKNRKSKGKIIKRRLRRCCVGSQSIATVALLVVMGIIGVNGIFGNNILTSSVSAFANDQSTPQTISNNIDTVLLLQEEESARLTQR